MTISAHPSAGVLSDYASGALPTVPGLVVAAHLEFCSACRAAVRASEEANGALLRAASAEGMAPEALARALERIEGIAPDPVARPLLVRRPDELPLVIAAVGVGRRRSLGPGRWLAPVCAPRMSDWRLFLLQVPAETIVRNRARARLSFVCILKGGCRRGAVVYHAGDFVELPGGSSPMLALVPGRPLLALVATRTARRR